MTQEDFPKSAKDFFAYVKKNQAEMVDLKFVDMLGSWQHCSYPVDTLDEGTFEEGLGFDGSSIRGWMGIHESDMMAVPDAATARLDPFFAKPTVSVIANVVDPVTRKEFARDPRHVARKAEVLPWPPTSSVFGPAERGSGADRPRATSAWQSSQPVET